MRLADPPAAVSGGATAEVVLQNVALALEHRVGARVKDPQHEVAALDPLADPPGLLSWRDPIRFVALAVPIGRKARDLYRLEARVAGNGRIVDIAWVVNLTRTSEADEGVLAVQGESVAIGVMSEGRLAAVEVRDFAGENETFVGTAAWPDSQQAANRITNLEQTGQAAGVGLTHFAVAGEGPAVADLRFDETSVGVLQLRTREGGIVARLTATVPSRFLDGTLVLEAAPMEQKMQMDLLNWVADRGRGFADQGLAPAWLGSSVEMAKEVYFSAKEVKASVEELAPASPDEGRPLQAPAEVAAQEEAVEVALELARRQAQESDFPWPPAPIDPILSPAWEGEGLWKPIGSDRVSPAPDGTPLLYETFIRPSDDYARKSVFFFVWDPRKVELHMRGGTHEPIPQTANRGDGQIPRDPDGLSRLVAAFNGGFQTTHREFGMMVDRKVLLKPRNLGATIALLDDGRPAFGTWRKREPIPPEWVSFRQNLEPLIEDGIFNAYHRVRFGNHENVAGAKDGWTVRSALCFTSPGHMMFVYAQYVNERALATTLKRANCNYAIHLDMNPGHTGIELYRQLGPVSADGLRADRVEDAPIDPANVRELAGIRLEGVLPNANIRHMNRPTRYIATDYRDFFYLIRRRTLPGRPLGSLTPAEDDGVWETARLPHGHDTPPRLASTTLRTLSGAKMDVWAVDPAGVTVTAGTAPATGSAGLMVSLPWSSGAGGTLAFGSVQVTGPALLPGDVPEAVLTAFGLDGDGMGLFVQARNASPSEMLAAFQTRRATTVLRSSEASGPVWLYDTGQKPDGSAALIELEPGQEQGVLVSAPSTSDPRLFVHSKPWKDRTVRYWPDANR